MEQKISLNTLINHLLEKQVNWNELIAELGWIPILRSTFRELTDTISKEKIEKIAGRSLPGPFHLRSEDRFAC